MGNTLRKQPPQGLDLDELFRQLEASRAAGAAGPPPAPAPKRGFIQALCTKDDSGPPDFDVDTIHLRYPISDAERLYLFKQNVWCMFLSTFVSSVEGTVVIPSLYLYIKSLGGNSLFYGSLIACFWVARCTSLVYYGTVTDNTPFAQLFRLGFRCGVSSRPSIPSLSCSFLRPREAGRTAAWGVGSCSSP